MHTRDVVELALAVARTPQARRPRPPQRRVRRAAARRRQGRDPQGDPQQARRAGRRRVGDHAHPHGRGPADARPRRRLHARGRRDRPRLARALGRRRLSGRARAATTIPLEARIIAACDAYNAMTTTRPYRAAMDPAAAAAELQRCSGSQFDPTVVEALLAVAGSRGARAARPRRVEFLNGPDRPAHGDQRVPPVRDLLRSRDRPAHLHRRRLPEPLLVRRPAHRPPLHGLPACRSSPPRSTSTCSGQAERTQARLRHGAARQRAAAALPLHGRAGVRRPRAGGLPVREQALLRLAGRCAGRGPGLRPARSLRE